MEGKSSPQAEIGSKPHTIDGLVLGGEDHTRKSPTSAKRKEFTQFRSFTPNLNVLDLEKSTIHKSIMHDRSALLNSRIPGKGQVSQHGIMQPRWRANRAQGKGRACSDAPRLPRCAQHQCVRPSHRNKAHPYPCGWLKIRH